MIFLQAKTVHQCNKKNFVPIQEQARTSSVSKGMSSFSVTNSFDEGRRGISVSKLKRKEKTTTSTTHIRPDQGKKLHLYLVDEDLTSTAETAQ